MLLNTSTAVNRDRRNDARDRRDDNRDRRNDTKDQSRSPRGPRHVKEEDSERPPARGRRPG